MRCDRIGERGIRALPVQVQLDQQSPFKRDSLGSAIRRLVQCALEIF
jgi:hypothetical protein